MFLSHDEYLDWRMLIAFGLIENAQSRDHLLGVNEYFSFASYAPGGAKVGSKVVGSFGFDPGAPESEEV